MVNIDIKTLSSLAESLRTRHLHDNEALMNIYGEDIHFKFAGMEGVVKRFLRELEDALQT